MSSPKPNTGIARSMAGAAASQQVLTMTASGSTTYNYDANGNQTSRTAGGTTTTYAWDALDRLASITTGGSTTATYTYNGDGLRTRKVVGSTTTDYTWDPTGIGTVIGDGTEYVWGLGLISQGAGSGAVYPHADGLGSIRALSDNTGASIGSSQYDAFGAKRSPTGTQLPFGYTGEQQDVESGLVYLRARYLDPQTGRFLSRDPIGARGYVNVGNSTCNLRPRNGMAAFSSAIPNVDY